MTRRLTERDLDELVVDQRFPPAGDAWWETETARKIVALIHRVAARAATTDQCIEDEAAD